MTKKKNKTAQPAATSNKNAPNNNSGNVNNNSGNFNNKQSQQQQPQQQHKQQQQQHKQQQQQKSHQTSQPTSKKPTRQFKFDTTDNDDYMQNVLNDFRQNPQEFTVHQSSFSMTNSVSTAVAANNRYSAEQQHTLTSQQHNAAAVDGDEETTAKHNGGGNDLTAQDMRQIMDQLTELSTLCTPCCGRTFSPSGQGAVSCGHCNNSFCAFCLKHVISGRKTPELTQHTTICSANPRPGYSSVSVLAHIAELTRGVQRALLYSLVRFSPENIRQILQDQQIMALLEHYEIDSSVFQSLTAAASDEQTQQQQQQQTQAKLKKSSSKSSQQQQQQPQSTESPSSPSDPTISKSNNNDPDDFFSSLLPENDDSAATTNSPTSQKQHSTFLGRNFLDDDDEFFGSDSELEDVLNIERDEALSNNGSDDFTAAYQDKIDVVDDDDDDHDEDDENDSETENTNNSAATITADRLRELVTSKQHVSVPSHNIQATDSGTLISMLDDEDVTPSQDHSSSMNGQYNGSSSSSSSSANGDDTTTTITNENISILQQLNDFSALNNLVSTDDFEQDMDIPQYSSQNEHKHDDTNGNDPSYLTDEYDDNQKDDEPSEPTMSSAELLKMLTAPRQRNGDDATDDLELQQFDQLHRHVKYDTATVSDFIRLIQGLQIAYACRIPPGDSYTMLWDKMSETIEACADLETLVSIVNTDSHESRWSFPLVVLAACIELFTVDIHKLGSLGLSSWSKLLQSPQFDTFYRRLPSPSQNEPLFSDSQLPDILNILHSFCSIVISCLVSFRLILAAGCADEAFTIIYVLFFKAGIFYSLKHDSESEFGISIKSLRILQRVHNFLSTSSSRMFLESSTGSGKTLIVPIVLSLTCFMQAARERYSDRLAFVERASYVAPGVHSIDEVLASESTDISRNGNNRGRSTAPKKKKSPKNDPTPSQTQSTSQYEQIIDVGTRRRFILLVLPTMPILQSQLKFFLDKYPRSLHVVVQTTAVLADALQELDVQAQLDQFGLHKHSSSSHRNIDRDNSQSDSAQNSQTDIPTLILTTPRLFLAQLAPFLTAHDPHATGQKSLIATNPANQILVDEKMLQNAADQGRVEFLKQFTTGKLFVSPVARLLNSLHIIADEAHMRTPYFDVMMYFVTTLQTSALPMALIIMSATLDPGLDELTRTHTTLAQKFIAAASAAPAASNSLVSRKNQKEAPPTKISLAHLPPLPSTTTVSEHPSSVYPVAIKTSVSAAPVGKLLEEIVLYLREIYNLMFNPTYKQPNNTGIGQSEFLHIPQGHTLVFLAGLSECHQLQNLVMRSYRSNPSDYVTQLIFEVQGDWLSKPVMLSHLVRKVAHAIVTQHPELASIIHVDQDDIAYLDEIPHDISTQNQRLLLEQFRAVSETTFIINIAVSGHISKLQQSLATSQFPYSEHPLLQCTKKTIFSNSLLESSFTIAGLTAMVDSGRNTIHQYDPQRAITVSTVEPITQDSRTQRLGRVGRTMPGIAYQIYYISKTPDTSGKKSAAVVKKPPPGEKRTAESTNAQLIEDAKKQHHSDPEILHTDIGQLLLTLRSFGISLELINAFLPTAIPARSLVDTTNMLTTFELILPRSLTPLGRDVNSFPKFSVLFAYTMARFFRDNEDDPIALLFAGVLITIMTMGENMLQNVATNEPFLSLIADEHSELASVLSAFIAAMIIYPQNHISLYRAGFNTQFFTRALTAAVPIIAFALRQSPALWRLVYSLEFAEKGGIELPNEAFSLSSRSMNQTISDLVIPPPPTGPTAQTVISDNYLKHIARILAIWAGPPRYPSHEQNEAFLEAALPNHVLLHDVTRAALQFLPHRQFLRARINIVLEALEEHKMGFTEQHIAIFRHYRIGKHLQTGTASYETHDRQLVQVQQPAWSLMIHFPDRVYISLFQLRRIGTYSMMDGFLLHSYFPKAPLVYEDRRVLDQWLIAQSALNNLQLPRAHREHLASEALQLANIQPAVGRLAVSSYRVDKGFLANPFSTVLLNVFLRSSSHPRSNLQYPTSSAGLYSRSLHNLPPSSANNSNPAPALISALTSRQAMTVNDDDITTMSAFHLHRLDDIDSISKATPQGTILVFAHTVRGTMAKYLNIVRSLLPFFCHHVIVQTNGVMAMHMHQCYNEVSRRPDLLPVDNGVCFLTPELHSMAWIRFNGPRPSLQTVNAAAPSTTTQQQSISYARPFLYACNSSTLLFYIMQIAYLMSPDRDPTQHFRKELEATERNPDATAAAAAAAIVAQRQDWFTLAPFVNGLRPADIVPWSVHIPTLHPVVVYPSASCLGLDDIATRSTSSTSSQDGQSGKPNPTTESDLDVYPNSTGSQDVSAISMNPTLLEHSALPLTAPVDAEHITNIINVPGYGQSAFVMFCSPCRFTSQSCQKLPESMTKLSLRTDFMEIPWSTFANGGKNSEIARQVKASIAVSSTPAEVVEKSTSRKSTSTTTTRSNAQFFDSDDQDGEDEDDNDDDNDNNVDDDDNDNDDKNETNPSSSPLTQQDTATSTALDVYRPIAPDHMDQVLQHALASYPGFASFLDPVLSQITLNVNAATDSLQITAPVTNIDSKITAQVPFSSLSSALHAIDPQYSLNRIAQFNPVYSYLPSSLFVLWGRYSDKALSLCTTLPLSPRAADMGFLSNNLDDIVAWLLNTYSTIRHNIQNIARKTQPHFSTFIPEQLVPPIAPSHQIAAIRHCLAGTNTDMGSQVAPASEACSHAIDLLLSTLPDNNCCASSQYHSYRRILSSPRPKVLALSVQDLFALIHSVLPPYVIIPLALPRDSNTLSAQDVSVPMTYHPTLHRLVTLPMVPDLLPGVTTLPVPTVSQPFSRHQSALYKYHHTPEFNLSFLSPFHQVCCAAFAVQQLKVTVAQQHSNISANSRLSRPPTMYTAYQTFKSYPPQWISDAHEENWEYEAASPSWTISTGFSEYSDDSHHSSSSRDNTSNVTPSTLISFANSSHSLQQISNDNYVPIEPTLCKHAVTLKIHSPPSVHPAQMFYSLRIIMDLAPLLIIHLTPLASFTNIFLVTLTHVNVIPLFAAILHQIGLSLGLYQSSEALAATKRLQSQQALQKAHQEQEMIHKQQQQQLIIAKNTKNKSAQTKIKKQMKRLADAETVALRANFTDPERSFHVFPTFMFHLEDTFGLFSALTATSSSTTNTSNNGNNSNRKNKKQFQKQQQQQQDHEQQPLSQDKLFEQLEQYIAKSVEPVTAHPTAVIPRGKQGQSVQQQKTQTPNANILKLFFARLSSTLLTSCTNYLVMLPLFNKLYPRPIVNSPTWSQCGSMTFSAVNVALEGMYFQLGPRTPSHLFPFLQVASVIEASVYNNMHYELDIEAALASRIDVAFEDGYFLSCLNLREVFELFAQWPMLADVVTVMMFLQADEQSDYQQYILDQSYQEADPVSEILESSLRTKSDMQGILDNVRLLRQIIAKVYRVHITDVSLPCILHSAGLTCWIRHSPQHLEYLLSSYFIPTDIPNPQIGLESMLNDALNEKIPQYNNIIRAHVLPMMAGIVNISTAAQSAQTALQLAQTHGASTDLDESFVFAQMSRDNPSCLRDAVIFPSNEQLHLPVVVATVKLFSPAFIRVVGESTPVPVSYIPRSKPKASTSRYPSILDSYETRPLDPELEYYAAFFNDLGEPCGDVHFRYFNRHDSNTPAQAIDHDDPVSGTTLSAWYHGANPIINPLTEQQQEEQMQKFFASLRAQNDKLNNASGDAAGNTGGGVSLQDDGGDDDFYFEDPYAVDEYAEDVIGNVMNWVATDEYQSKQATKARQFVNLGHLKQTRGILETTTGVRSKQHDTRLGKNVVKQARRRQANEDPYAAFFDSDDDLLDDSDIFSPAPANYGVTLLNPRENRPKLSQQEKNKRTVIWEQNMSSIDFSPIDTSTLWSVERVFSLQMSWTYLSPFDRQSSASGALELIQQTLQNTGHSTPDPVTALSPQQLDMLKRSHIRPAFTLQFNSSCPIVTCHMLTNAMQSWLDTCVVNLDITPISSSMGLPFIQLMNTLSERILSQLPPAPFNLAAKPSIDAFDIPTTSNRQQTTGGATTALPPVIVQTPPLALFRLAYIGLFEFIISPRPNKGLSPNLLRPKLPTHLLTGLFPDPHGVLSFIHHSLRGAEQIGTIVPSLASRLVHRQSITDPAYLQSLGITNIQEHTGGPTDHLLSLESQHVLRYRYNTERILEFTNSKSLQQHDADLLHLQVLARITSARWFQQYDLFAVNTVIQNRHKLIVSQSATVHQPIHAHLSYYNTLWDTDLASNTRSYLVVPSPNTTDFQNVMRSWCLQNAHEAGSVASDADILRPLTPILSEPTLAHPKPAVLFLAPLPLVTNRDTNNYHSNNDNNNDNYDDDTQDDNFTVLDPDDAVIIQQTSRMMVSKARDIANVTLNRDQLFYVPNGIFANNDVLLEWTPIWLMPSREDCQSGAKVKLQPTGLHNLWQTTFYSPTRLSISLSSLVKTLMSHTLQDSVRVCFEQKSNSLYHSMLQSFSPILYIDLHKLVAPVPKSSTDQNTTTATAAAAAAEKNRPWNALCSFHYTDGIANTNVEISFNLVALFHYVFHSTIATRQPVNSSEKAQSDDFLLNQTTYRDWHLLEQNLPPTKKMSKKVLQNISSLAPSKIISPYNQLSLASVLLKIYLFQHATRLQADSLATPGLAECCHQCPDHASFILTDQTTMSALQAFDAENNNGKNSSANDTLAPHACPHLRPDGTVCGWKHCSRCGLLHRGPCSVWLHIKTLTDLAAGTLSLCCGAQTSFQTPHNTSQATLIERGQQPLQNSSVLTSKLIDIQQQQQQTPTSTVVETHGTVPTVSYCPSCAKWLCRLCGYSQSNASSNPIERCEEQTQHLSRCKHNLSRSTSLPTEQVHEAYLSACVRSAVLHRIASSMTPLLRQQVLRNLPPALQKLQIAENTTFI